MAPTHSTEEGLPSDVALARWLEESGRRKAIRPESSAAIDAWRRPAKAPRVIDALRRPLLLGLLGLALLQYLYVDVNSQLLALRQLIFFINVV